MDRQTELRLVEAALAVATGSSRPTDDEEAAIDVARYVETERWEAERAVLRRQLHVVGLATAVPEPGDFVTQSVMGTPTIVVRGEDGRVRAFVNVCRHRGAQVELSARGRCKQFVCPYHAWTYRTDGSLLRVRHADGFPSLDVASSGLAELACHEAAGLLWVCPDPAVQPAAPEAAILTELTGIFGERPTAFATTTQVFAANWKLIVDGALESYHFKIAHKNTIGPAFGDTQSIWERVGSHLRLVLPRRSITALADVPRQQWDLREHANLVYALHPNAMVLLQATHFELILSTPLSPSSTHVSVSTVGRAPGPDGYSDRAGAFLQGNHDFTVKTLLEDFVLAEQIQAGLTTGANQTLRFGRFEGALIDWHRRLDAALERP